VRRYGHVDATPLPAAPGWRVLPFEVDAAEALHQRSVQLLDGLADEAIPALRWYRAATPAIVLGRGQVFLPPAEAVLGLTSRFSGGGAVLMDEGLLSLDVLLPRGHALLDGDIGVVFERIGTAWAGALEDLGVHGVALHRGPGTARWRGTPRERLLAAVCYATTGRGEVLVAGRKVVGFAQRRRRPGALVQCGLLRRWCPGPLLAALGADPADETIAQSAVGLDDLMPLPPSDAVVIEAVHGRLAMR
jgi:lipoate---protein ligase